MASGEEHSENGSDGAPGVDDEDGSDQQLDLEEQLEDLMVNQPDLSAMKKPTNTLPTNQDMQALAEGDLEGPRRAEKNGGRSRTDGAQKMTGPPSSHKPEEAAQPMIQSAGASGVRSGDGAHHDAEELEQFIERQKKQRIEMAESQAESHEPEDGEVDQGEDMASEKSEPQETDDLPQHRIINITKDGTETVGRTKRKKRGQSHGAEARKNKALRSAVLKMKLPSSIAPGGAMLTILASDLKSRQRYIGKSAQIDYANGSKYYGKIFKAQPHGYGVKTWPDGKRYQGNWLRGRMHGNGELLLGGQGESFAGEFKSGLPWGLGIRKWANGDYYEGEYFKGYQQGSGLFISKEQGWKYDGQWEGGKMNGVAVCQWADGTTYTGEWKQCQKEGHGTLQFPDGSIYKGQFRHDQPNGQGQKVFPDGSTYEGQFLIGMFHGHGKFKQASDHSEYDGNWRQNKMKGYGTKKSNNGAIEISGNFDGKNMVNGKGYKKWKNIRYEQSTHYPFKQIKAEEMYVYRGSLKDSQIQGYGEFKWPDGRHYIGDFVNS